MQARTAARSRPAVWLGSAAALVIGLPILLWGVLTKTTPELQWFVALCDGVAFVCMVVVALLGSLDAELRQNWRSLPIVFVACSTAVMWAGHFAVFPGDVPALAGQRFNQATSTLFLTINLLMPLMLSVALLQRGGALARPRAFIVGAVTAGVLLGLLVIAVSVAVGPNLQTVSPAGEFLEFDAPVGVAGLILALLGLLAYSVGLHGDERIAGGVLGALTFTALNSISLLYLHARYTPSWYADHVLALLPFAALLAGQLWLYSGSVLAERSAASAVAMASERRRIGLDIAKAMARETDPMPVVDRLLNGVIDALTADRVTMLRLVPEGFVVEHSVDRQGRSANVGVVLSLDSVVAGKRKVVSEAVERQRPIVLGSYRVIGLDSDAEEGHAGILRSVVMPLVRGGTVDGVLIVGRRTHRPFTEADVDQLAELGAIAALVIRNSRLLADAESSSRAKSNFINLAAHEFGTPIAVIRGYVDMIADETLGRLTSEQRGPMDAIRATAADLAERVDQLLIASRLEAGVSPQAVDSDATADLGVVVREAVVRAKDRAALIGAAIEINIPAVPVVAEGSARDIGIIVDNLLNNAMTYSRGPAQVSVKVAGGESPEIRVSDQGIGIPEAAKERIFDQFYRVDDVDFGYPAGTGLGLYIGRRLAERHGGQLLLERSSPDAGSVFTLRLRRPNA